MNNSTSPVHKGAIYYRVRAAIDKGVLTPASICELCGANPRPGRRLDAHHHKGYAPDVELDVQWLCTRCHNVVHAGPAGAQARHANKTPEQQRAIGQRISERARAKSPEERSAATKRGWATIREKYTPEQISAARRKLNFAARSRIGHMGGTATNKIRLECECGMITAPGAMGGHIKKSGHSIVSKTLKKA